MQVLSVGLMVRSLFVRMFRSIMCENTSLSTMYSPVTFFENWTRTRQVTFCLVLINTGRGRTSFEQLVLQCPNQNTGALLPMRSEKIRVLLIKFRVMSRALHVDWSLREVESRMPFVISCANDALLGKSAHPLFLMHQSTLDELQQQ